MAETQFTLDFIPGREGLKKNVVTTTTLLDPTSDEIWVGFGDTVRLGRGTEIVNGLRWLMQGISERNLLDALPSAGFQGAALVTAVDIDVLTVGNRRTSSSIAVTSPGGVDNDIFLAYGNAVTAEQVGMLRTTVNNLIRAVQEFLYKH